jgi:hypothetical protein
VAASDAAPSAATLPILRAVLRLAVSRVRIVHSVVIPDPVK